LIHELGHVIAAKVVGLAPAQLIIGHPDKNAPLFSFRLFGLSLECWPIPFGGATIFATPPHTPLQTFIVTIGGPIFDALVILVCSFLWQHTFLRLGLAAIILSQAVNVLRNLIPVSSLYGRVRVPSDGKVILQLLGRSVRPNQAMQLILFSLASFARLLRGRGGGQCKLAFPDKYQIADVYHRIGEIGQDADRVTLEDEVEAHDHAPGDAPIPERDRDHALALPL
jgi:hypothetical protein